MIDSARYMLDNDTAFFKKVFADNPTIYNSYGGLVSAHSHLLP